MPKEPKNVAAREAIVSKAMGPNLGQVMSTLNRVFAGEIEYDEALQEFGLFTAEVRKNYPELYKALQRGSAQAEAKPLELRPLKEDPAWQEMVEFQHKLEKIFMTALAVPKEALVPQRLGMNLAVAQTEAVPQNGAGATAESEEDLPFGLTADGQRIYGYRAWVKGEMLGAQPGSEWNVRWDVERGGELAPMPNVGGPLTVPMEGGNRMRFSVLEAEGNIMLLRYERLLPPKQG